MARSGFAFFVLKKYDNTKNTKHFTKNAKMENPFHPIFIIQTDSLCKFLAGLFDDFVEAFFKLRIRPSQSRYHVLAPIDIGNLAFVRPVVRRVVGYIGDVADLVGEFYQFCSVRQVRSVFDLQSFSFVLRERFVCRRRS